MSRDLKEVVEPAVLTSGGKVVEAEGIARRRPRGWPGPGMSDTQIQSEQGIEWEEAHQR